MEQLLKQRRLKSSGVGQEQAEGTSDIKDSKTPAQKTPSFKGDKRSQSWLQRQFTKQMSRSDEPAGEDEVAAAVAAAALAVERIQDSDKPNRSLMSPGPERSLTRAKSKRQSASRRPETGEESIKIPITGPAQPVQKRPSFAEKLLESTEDAEEEGAPTPPKPSPSMKRASSSADKQFEKVPSMKPEILPSPTSERLPTIKPPPPPPRQLKTGQSSAIPGGEQKADVWIREEMSRINERYAKLNSTINTWETRKKKKARSKLIETEGEMEKKRTNALNTYQTEMDSVEKFTAAARKQAEERQRNEELKAQEKANRIRTTGKLPTKCLCF
ncbi:hypothetical protein ACJRO7_012390 [Eucalyptus globulus]|uniref:Remorin C-terminal domain-containing protein n=1 Tax=Eucalyptus globulus TaxID=34317 RepID=A0ABD3LIF2_EUCGL